jgi:uncharacterized protein (DUF1499 family)
MNKKKGNTMTVLIIMAGLMVLMTAGMIVQNNRIPANIGHGDGRLSPMPKSPNAVSSQTDDPEKRVEPLPMRGDAESSLDALEALVASHGAQVITREGGYLHVVYTTPAMKFKDDVEFLADADAGVIHFRSASRTGYGDMGVNRQRYDRIRSEYLGGDSGQ